LSRKLRLLIGIMAVLVALVVAGGGRTLASAAPADPATQADQQRVVLVGIAGLAWPDVTAQDMPTLFDLAGSNAAGSLVVRTARPRTCIVDGWLTLGAGRRATDVIDSDDDGENDRFCRQPADPLPTDAGGAVVPGWSALVEQQDENSYNAQLGLLGDRLKEAGVCAMAVGPGAAMALADSTGHVESYRAESDDVDRRLMNRCPLTVIDGGGLPSPVPEAEDLAEPGATAAPRRHVTATIDQFIGHVIEELPSNTALVIVGLADSGSTPVPSPDEPTPIAPAGLRVAVASGPMADRDTYQRNWLTSSSTHWPGLVQLTDIAPTLLSYAGIEDPSTGFAGRPWKLSGSHPTTAAATVSELMGVDRAAQIYRSQSGPFFQILGGAQLVIYSAALVLLRRYRPRARVSRMVQAGAVIAAAAPVASYLANVTHWWKYDNPTAVLWGSIAVLTTVVAAIALFGPWRHRSYGPSGIVAGVTATVMALDVVSGSSLQQSSLLGLSPLVAGRFYGFGNIPFAIFVVASLVAAAALGQWLIDRGWSRRACAIAVAVVGAVAVAIDGAPQAGADVGGILAAVPGFAVLVLGILGARVTVVRVTLAGVGAIALFTVSAWLDWLRPADARTHFGDFFADMISGEAWTVIWRKAEASLGTVGRWPIYGVIVPLVYLIILHLSRMSSTAMRETVRCWSLVPSLISAALLTGAVGFAVNDSGIIVPALLLTVGVPLVLAAVAAAYGQQPTRTYDTNLVDREQSAAS
jgi:hypothetical protein